MDCIIRKWKRKNNENKGNKEKITLQEKGGKKRKRYLKFTGLRKNETEKAV